MIKIITALGDPILNSELSKYSEFNVLCKDVQYIDGIIEILEINSDVDFILVSELLEGQINFEELIKKILNINRKIKIIAIIDKKNTGIENKLLSEGVYDILYDGVNVFDIINLLKNKNIEIINKELKAEIENLKEIILNKKDNKENIFTKIIKKHKRKNECVEHDSKCKVITVAGNRGIGKTTFSIMISNIIKRNKKVLLVDLDLINNDITNIFGLKNNKVEKSIKQIDDNFYVWGNINFLYYIKKNNFNNIINDIEEMKYNYDYIIIDIYSELIFELNKFIFNKSDYILFLTKVNKLEVQRNKKIINFILNVWNINREKINLVIYKYRILDLFYFYKLNKNKIFKNIEVIGKIKYNLFLDIFLSLNFKNILIDIKNKFNYFSILKKISKKD